MRAHRTFTVRAHLPETLAPLEELAMNLRWAWDERTRDLFRWVEPGAWEEARHDPVQLLSKVDGARLNALARDPAFMSFLGEVHADLQRYMALPRWFQSREETPLRAVAYFSPEFGIAEALPQYSGGLGVLAGDHLKAASGLGVPLVGVGLFYRQGYFRQQLNAEGWQQEHYPTLDPHAMALRLVDGARVEVDLAGTPLVAQIWQAQVGRIRLYLLDTDLDENDDEGRSVTDRLYGGGVEHRIRQEILLGIGGVRALQTVGETTQVFHTNEGHAGFLGLERVRDLMVTQGLTFREAVEAVRAGTVFTTHTPVPAGIDLFPRELMERYFKSWAAECSVSFDELMALGHFDEEPPEAPFNMAVMGLRLAGMANGVSKLHGLVSREMFHSLWPDVPVDEVPITSVTNGVHGNTWISAEMNDLLTRHVLPTWYEAESDTWKHLQEARDDELWRVREESRERLVEFVRSRLKTAALARGTSETDAAWTDEALDPRFVVIGFARRFAAYKRATLLLSQPDRLKALLLSPDHPIQLVFAGKAHPADDIGKEMIRQIVHFSSDPSVRHRIAFIEDYDIGVARTLYQGSDVWLNNPRRPLEACGTSGEKAALNGALNCSILDGWWAEMFNGENGWAISSAESYSDLDRRDHAEADSLFEILERQVVPLFYDRAEGRLPKQWVRRVKSSLISLGPQVLASRMVRDYIQQMYEPVAAHTDALAADGFSRAKQLAEWKERMLAAWDNVRVESVEADTTMADLGTTRNVEVVVALGSLSQDDVAVEVVHGPTGPNDELITTSVTPMTPAGDGRYAGTFVAAEAGRYGFTVRVLPRNPEMLQTTELGLMAWA